MTTEFAMKDKLVGENPSPNPSNAPSKTVWIINQHTATPHTTNGHFRHYYLAREFKRKGYKVCLIIGSYSHLSKRKEQPSKQFTFELVDDIHICTVKVPKYGIGRSVGRIFNLIVFCLKLFFLPNNKLPKPDYILVSSMPLFPILNGYRLKKRFKNCKLIFEIRDIWPLTIIELGQFSARHPFVRLLAAIEKFGYRKADYITSVLPHTDEHIAGTIKKPFKFRHIPNGIDLESYEEQSVPLNAETLAGIPKDKFIVGYAGTLGHANAMEFFVEAARKVEQHEDIAFVLVGEGYLKADLQDAAKGLSNIHFLNAIPKHQMPALLQRFDLCFLGWRASKLYHFGVSANKIYDYMYSGRPIVMVGDIRSNEISKTGCGVTLAYDDADALAKQIFEFCRMSRHERHEIGRKGKDYVLKNNTYQKLSERYMEIFTELTASTKGIASEKLMAKDK